MKTVYLVRHAKSSWSHPHLDDFDRPLNKRGKRDAPEMGRKLAGNNIMPDLMISSTANRAKTTCLEIAETLNYPKNQILFTDELYHAHTSEISAIISKTEDKYNTIMLFGHNPGFTFFANQFSDSFIHNLPTCGVFGCQFDINQWHELKDSKGKNHYLDFPKSKF